MNYNISFAPELPVWLIALIAAMILIPVIWALVQKMRGSWLRLLALAALLLALLNPSLFIEDREPLKSVVALVVDKSASQKLDGREQQTDKTVAVLKSRLEALQGFEVRQIEASDQISSTTDASTALFGALQTGLRDISQDRLAGAVMVTDGQVHDIPEKLSELGLSIPIHALVTGREDEYDRRIVITEAPRYGVVGTSYELSYKVLEDGTAKRGPVDVSIYIDGELITTETVTPGDVNIFYDNVRHGGQNIIELRVAVDKSGPGGKAELSETNNRIFTKMNGIRENLRVLLVSGEPHSGERTWRNLLKSDASVDLVHFTILRPPEKQDGTPINQLSLIAFPTRELFVEKIDEFDLIIFDRYSRRGVLPLLYFENIARYVRNGGAVLVAAGPEFAEDGSIAQTPLADILPATPNGIVSERPFKPRVSEIGNRHPVTRNLDGNKADMPTWSRWFRSIGTASATGEVVMENEAKEPLLVLQRFDEGRVALLLSDHAWLWARGFEGGGPHVQLLRRMAHWLMKEPELEEERLTAATIGNKLTITRQTLGGKPADVTIVDPTGNSTRLAFEESADGEFTATLDNPSFGLNQINNSDLTTLVQVGPANPREYAEVVSTTAKISPVLEGNGGAVLRVNAQADNLPRLLPIRKGGEARGSGWIGFQNTGATVLKGINRVSLFTGFLGLSILLLLISMVWVREGR